MDVKGPFDVLPHLVVRLKVDFDERLEALRKAADGCGFANLSCAAHDDVGLTKRYREYVCAFRAAGLEDASNVAFHDFVNRRRT